MPKKLFLIDGHALIFKMYYAFLRHPLVNSKGVDTSILFGFTKSLLEIIAKEQPTHFAVSFDPPGGTFRNKIYSEYKANRPPTPELVIEALEPLSELCRSLGFPVFTIPGFEADDVIGSLAKKAEREGFEVYMVTPDKDYGQLISDHIFQYKMGKNGDERQILGPKEVCEKYGICRPEQVIDMLAICGDTSDNVPGVSGVGEVGASKLIAKYGSLEAVYEHLGELSASLQKKFSEAEPHIALSKELVTIKTDIDLDVDFDKAAISPLKDNRAAEIFDQYEFGSLKRYLKELFAVEVKPSPAPQKKEFAFEIVGSTEVCHYARESGSCAVSLLESGKICLAVGSKACLGTPTDFAEVLSDEGIIKYGYELKPQIKRLPSIKGPLKDIALMDYLINPEKSHSLEQLCLGELGVELQAEGEPQKELSLFEEASADADEASEKSDCRKASILFALARKKEAELDTLGLSSLYDEMEGPLLRVLASMETQGVKMDLSCLSEYAKSLGKEVAIREARIREMADEPELNVQSPKQLGVVLFEKLALDPRVKKSKNGSYPTDEETLSSLSWKSPIAGEILEYRAAKKLLSTYIEPFPALVDARDGKIHTTFNLSLTATGRLSSSKPNLQNIPIRTERGKPIRKAFVPSRQDGLIMSADYSQIELRIMAHMSCDEHLCRAFREGEDVHKATAAKIFGIPSAEVTPDQRRIAKTANFGIMYGISSFGLAQRLKVGRSEAKQIIDDYFESFPAIRSYIDATLEGARSNGYVETLYGRRRYLPDINAHNANLRALSERNAINAPIQGTSADIIKLAMIGVDRCIREEGLESRMVLQIHDELLFDVAPGEAEALRELVVSEMENVIQLSIPLTVECNAGKNWLEAH